MSENPSEIDVYAIAQQLGDEKQVRRSTAGRDEPEGLQEKFDKLSEKYEELYCLSRSVWELLEETTDLQESDLQAKLAIVKARQQPATKPKAEGCPECDRPLQRIEGKHHRCIYCGYIQEFKSPFDKLL
ncbi:hypothetical protein Lepto7376_4395 [[Leptolyngbya] sp. PCC 7376]|uniref:hypothetical protein n=1 Tax=[Leptolyngbya] sp. PCC 7376 TaxID=111781 RepID=UPI00029F1FF9|nr:hypothetical protein [[Leptolyngbya] sp. PCC 7376]AFY40503.1 hypothetical protein Lepto7376_4395 [[Leptolyngbya] sp. PCC 7376]